MKFFTITITNENPVYNYVLVECLTHANTHTHTHTNTYMHTHTHINTYTYTHTHTNTYTHTHKHTHSHTHTHTHTPISHILTIYRYKSTATSEFYIRTCLLIKSTTSTICARR